MFSFCTDHDNKRVGDDGVERLPAAVGPLPLRRRQGPPRPLQDALAAGHRPLQQRRRQLRGKQVFHPITGFLDRISRSLIR